MRIYDVVNKEPDATRKECRAMVDTMILNERGEVTGFRIRYSKWRHRGVMWAMEFRRLPEECEE